ncbi:nucleotidyltransferase domain-containing protein [bacterium]|nr:nucleotidyltransferase domain-containing protein [bacterium]MBU1959403.1 nucleotidyltransferase domain-containing protein [bacterium]
MRLTQFEKESIKQTFLNIFKTGKIYLFGSRVDDSKRGRDIDLYMVFDKKIAFLGELQSKIGEQKIDVVISKDKTRAIEEEALRTGIEL